MPCLPYKVKENGEHNMFSIVNGRVIAANYSVSMKLKKYIIVAVFITAGRKLQMTKGTIKELYSVMFTEYPDIVTVEDIQKMLGVSRHFAYKLINDGYICGHKIGSGYKIPKINVINYTLSA